MPKTTRPRRHGMVASTGVQPADLSGKPVRHEGRSLRWVPVLEGALAIGPRPGRGALERGFRDHGVSHVLTLLSEAEGAPAIGRALGTAGVGWLWLPLVGSRPPGRARTDEVRCMLDAVTRILAAGGHVYVHCAAGIHRTGMVTWAILRRAGMRPDEARVALEELRPLAAAEVGAERLAWAETFTRDGEDGG